MGCAPHAMRSPEHSPPNGASLEGDERRAAWTTIRNAQAKRLAGLEYFSSSAQLSLAWHEDGRDRWEQADARVWWELPDRMAIRLSRVGARLFMAGWSGQSWWVFDERGDEPSLSILPVSGRGTGEDQLISPPMVVALAGLVPFPEEPPADLSQVGEGAYRFTMPDARLGLVAEVEIDGRGPSRLVYRDGDREVAWSALQRREPVERVGAAMGDWPLLPRVVLAVFPGDNGHEDRMTLSIDRPRAGKAPPQRVFDLEAMRASIKPVRVDDLRESP